MAVPDTTDFTLRDVTDEVTPVGGLTLSDSFTEANDSLFDTEYKGAKDRLSNFRNYGVLNLPTITSLYKDTVLPTPYLNSLWLSSIIADGNLGSTYGCGIRWEPSELRTWGEFPYLGNWRVERTFVRFDLRDLPTDGTVTSAKLKFTYGVRNSGWLRTDPPTMPVIVRKYTDPLYVPTDEEMSTSFYNFDWAGSSQDKMFTSKTIDDSVVQNVTCIASASDRGQIEDYLGNVLEICFRENDDYQKSSYVDWGWSPSHVYYYHGCKLENIELEITLMP